MMSVEQPHLENGLCEATACGVGHLVLAEMVLEKNRQHCSAFPRMCKIGFQLYITLFPSFFAINT